MTKHRPLMLSAAAVLGLGSFLLAPPALAVNTDVQGSPQHNEVDIAPLDSEQLQDLALEAAALQTGEELSVLAQQRDAGEILIAQSGNIAVVDPAVPGNNLAVHTHARSESTPVPGDPIGGSRPGAPVTIYLDFDGERVEGTAWNDPLVTEQAEDVYDLEPAVGLDQAAIWEYIAEDYAPFNVNVTLSDPGVDALFKTSADDTTYGSHLVFTDSYPDFGAGSGGIAFIGGTGSEYLSPAFVFTQSFDGNSKMAADAGAHEVGHNFGLTHDGFGDAEYFRPGGGTWGPIMGAPYDSLLTQWSKGDYAQATNTEDDLAVITDRSSARALFTGFKNDAGDIFNAGNSCVKAAIDFENIKPGDVLYSLGVNGDCDPVGEAFTASFEFVDRADYVADDHGDDADFATDLDNSDNDFSASGVIGSTGDVDVFRLVTGAGEITARVDVADIGANLNSKLSLADFSGKVIAENNQNVALEDNTVTGLSSTVSAEVKAGIYYLSITGVGQGDPALVTVEAANDFSNYGSLGFYTVSGDAPAFDAEPVVITSPENRSSIEVGGVALEVVGTAEPGADVTLNANGAAYSAAANDSGDWSAEVRAAVAGETTIEASSVIDGIDIEGTDSIIVIAPVAEPIITSPQQDARFAEGPGFAGTGIAGAQVAIKIDHLDGESVAAAAAEAVTTTVDADGNWMLPGTALAEGKYEVRAAQTINNVTSDTTDAITFAVQAVVKPDEDTGSDSTADPAGSNGSNESKAQAVTISTGGAGNLAKTGSDLDATLMTGLIVLMFLAAGGVFTAVGARGRRVRVDS